MKRTLSLLLLASVIISSFASCSTYSPKDESISINDDGNLTLDGVKAEYSFSTDASISLEDGYIIINGVKTEYNVNKEDVISVENGFLVVNGVKTEFRVDKEDVIFVENGFLVVNGVKTEYRVDKEDVISIENGFLVVNGVKTEYRVAEDIPEQSNPKSNANYMHLSFDDVSVCFQNLTTEEYSSLFDEPFFAELKRLHEEYGARFSLYTYNSVLCNLSDRYADEFSSNCEWLKIGFHSSSSGFNLSDATYEQGLSYWNDFVENIKRACGSTDCIDRIPRLEYFAGSHQALLGMRDAEHGALGFLSADDNRLSYYFNDDVMTYMYDNDRTKDEESNLVFLSTDIRGDWFFNFTTSNTYRKPLKSTVLEELTYRNNNPSFEASFDSLIIFTHEWLVYNGTTLNSKLSVITDACRFAKENDIPFDYSQNRIHEDIGSTDLFDYIHSSSSN